MLCYWHVICHMRVTCCAFPNKNKKGGHKKEEEEEIAKQGKNTSN